MMQLDSSDKKKKVSVKMLEEKKILKKNTTLESFFVRKN